jgi:molybdate transport system substrate-binding protein
MIASTAARRAAALACAGALVAAWLPPAAAQSAPLRALSSNGVHAALEEVVPGCERAAGREFAIQFGTSASIRERIGGGEHVDVAFATKDVIGALVEAGHLARASVTPLGHAGIGVGIKAGGRRFAVGTAAQIKQGLLAAKAVTYAGAGASRPHIERMFERLGVAAEMRAKTLLEPGSVQAAEKVVAGEAEVLLTLVSEILPVEGMELLGPLPDEFQSYVEFEAALGAHAADAEAARAFVACIAAPSNAAAFAETGVDR